MVDKAPSKTVRILDIIAATGDAGLRFSDIQAALWQMSHPGVPFTRDLRGYWCTNLLGGFYYHAGILRTFCVKGPDGRWRTKRAHAGRPWAEMNAMSPGLVGHGHPYNS